MAAEDAIGCETIIAREPDYVAVRNDAAALFLELGQPDAARRHFEAVRGCSRSPPSRITT